MRGERGPEKMLPFLVFVLQISAVTHGHRMLLAQNGLPLIKLQDSITNGASAQD